MSLVKLAHNICISQFCLCDYWQTTSPLPCVIGTALHLVVTFLLREMPLSELIAGLPVQSFYVTLLLFHCTPSFSAEDMCRGTTSSHGNLCVKQQYKEKELQFSRACVSAQITHSMPPLAVLRSQQAQWEARLMLQDYTWELLQLPLTSLWSASHLPGTVPAVVRAGGKYLRMAKRIQSTPPVSTSVIQNRLLPTPRQVYTHATHLNTTQSWLLSSHKQSFPGLRIWPGAPVVSATARRNCGHHKARAVLRISFSSVLHSSIYILQ